MNKNINRTHYRIQNTRKHQDNYVKLCGGQANFEHHLTSLSKRVTTISKEVTQTTEVREKREILTTVCTKFVDHLAMKIGIGCIYSGHRDVEIHLNRKHLEKLDLVTSCESHIQQQIENYS